MGLFRRDSGGDAPGLLDRATAAREAFTDPSLSPEDRVSGFIDNMLKDPEAWVSGADPMTTAQASYLGLLATAAGDEDVALTAQTLGYNKSEASQRITAYRDAMGLPARTATD